MATERELNAQREAIVAASADYPIIASKIRSTASAADRFAVNWILDNRPIKGVRFNAKRIMDWIERMFHEFNVTLRYAVDETREFAEETRDKVIESAEKETNWALVAGGTVAVFFTYVLWDSDMLGAIARRIG